MSGGVFSQTLDRVLAWARSRSLWYFVVHTGCCADEVWDTVGCRYDLERFGCVRQSDPKQADLLIVSGSVSEKALPYLVSIYREMSSPKYVLTIGACACGGGLFPSSSKLEESLPVDVFVPGCPPRPEAIMDGLICLQEKIDGYRSVREKYQ